MTNLQIAEILRNVASSYEFKDQNKYKFQIIAYNRAADAIEHLTSELKDLWDDNKLDTVPSVGPSIASHLDELFRTGKSKHFEEVMKEIPSEAFKLMVLPKVGVKTAMKMLNELPRKEIDMKLKEAEKLLNKTKRHLLPYAEKVVSEVIEWLKEEPSTLQVDTLGSLRRKVATVGDIDIAVASDNPNLVLDKFANYPKLVKVIEKGIHTSSILLPGNVQVDLLVVEPASFGSALQHFTGSKHHNIALREYSLKSGYSMNEYGIKSTKEVNSKRKKFDTEKKLYEFLDLKYIDPELREDAGEIEAAKNDILPKLITIGDVKGDLQIHSDFNIETSHDLGLTSMEDLVKKAKELGYEYIAFTEHNPSRGKHNQNEIVELLKRKREKIDKLNYSISSSNNDRVFKVFNSLEIDIPVEGGLSIPEESLELLDFALVSIHSSFDMDRTKMTKRILSALTYPKVKIFAHPTARKLNEREGIEIDWEKVFDFCKTNDKYLEIDADPMRLDLPDSLVRDAVKNGVKLTLGTDTHEISMMDNMRYGVYVARRGWCEKKDMINCLDLNEFKEVIKK